MTTLLGSLNNDACQNVFGATVSGDTSTLGVPYGRNGTSPVYIITGLRFSQGDTIFLSLCLRVSCQYHLAEASVASLTAVAWSAQDFV
jgi:hypothetical protein